MAAQKVRLKLQCAAKMTGYRMGDQETVQLRFIAMYDPNPESENRQFWNATPSANIEFFTVNAQAADMFEAGKSYYVDFTPAE